MIAPGTFFIKDVNRKIDTVIKADDQANIFQEVDEYVITREISNKLADFFEMYNDPGETNGVWISGFFGSGKSHLLKILSYVLENKQYNEIRLGELFAEKIKDDVKLKGDLLGSLRKIHSESILFNIDQQAQITTKSDESAILKVFYKVFYDHQGFYGFQPHVAAFEESLFRDGRYEAFKQEFQAIYTQPWTEARKDYVKPQINQAIAQACARVYIDNPENYKDYLFKWQSQYKQSIEDLCEKISHYIESKGAGFRLNFFVDEVGQFIAEKTKLMLNLQTLTETLHTKCKSNSWIFVTSQEDLESLIGDESRVQSDDFSKIQGRFKVRMPLTSSSVDEVIEKRLLQKNDAGNVALTSVYGREKENIRTLFSFSNNGIQFRGYQDKEDFVKKYPFLPYQFDLFQQCIKSLSRHNVFQGQHHSVGERSMLGVFQHILKNLDLNDPDILVSYDQMFEGVAGTLRSEAQNAILVANNNLRNTHPMAIRVLKVLFLIKYFDSFKATARNIGVLLINHLKVDQTAHKAAVQEALNLLEQQSYIQVKGDEYEYLTDDEKDVEVEIKNQIIDNQLITQFISELAYEGTIRDNKIRSESNRQEFDFTRKVDGMLFGKEKELKIDIITPNNDSYEHEAFYNGSTMADGTLMLVKLPPEKRFIYEVRLYLQTEKYMKLAQSTAVKEAITRILFEKGRQNGLRKKKLMATINDLLAHATIYMNGVVNRTSSSNDGRTRILETAQDLIQLAYPKLRLLGSVTLDEAQLRVIMAKGELSLFNNDQNSLSAPEQEMLNLLGRRKTQHDRTTLSDLRDHFSRKPYGWSTMAVWCITALLFKKGKIEAKNAENDLDDKGMMDVFDNNRTWLSTLVSPQLEIPFTEVKHLKEVYLEAFNETNPYTEAKEVAMLFREKALTQQKGILQLLVEGELYPFLKALAPLADLLHKLAMMNYVELYKNFRNYEDELLDLKETVYDPIIQFWHSEQKNIFDQIFRFHNDNQANFDHIEAPERETLSQLLKESTPYKGDRIREGKQAMDCLAEKIRDKITRERQLLIEKAQEKINELNVSYEYLEASKDIQDIAVRPFEEIITKAHRQQYIGNLKSDRNSLSELYTRQLNYMVDNKPTPPTLPDVEDPLPRPTIRFTSIARVEKEVRLNKTQLENMEDVETYISKLREAIEKKIKENYRITLN